MDQQEGGGNSKADRNLKPNAKTEKQKSENGKSKPKADKKGIDRSSVPFSKKLAFFQNQKS